MKRKPDEKSTEWGQLAPGAPGVEVQCCAQPFSHELMLPAQPATQLADCQNTSGIDSTEMQKVAALFHTPSF